VHTMAVHFRAFWSGDLPTFQIVCAQEHAPELPR
jgi:hypothetical protein